jgi:Concanavalin A-like lectin/glucanases superfamily/Bacterial Ig domain
MLLGLAGVLCAQSSLTLSSATTTTGGTVPLNLSLSSPAGGEPAALQWTLTYTTGSVTSVSVAVGASATAAGKSISCAGGAAGYICTAFGLNSNTIANGVVAVVTVTLNASANTVSIGVNSAIGASPAGYWGAVSATGGSITTLLTLSSLACSPASVGPGGSSVCTIYLGAPAGAGGAIVTLNSNTSSLTVPTSVTVPAGSNNVGFTSTAGSFSSSQTATVTATLNGSSVATSIALAASNSTGGPTGSVGYWPFNTADSSGNTYLDESGNAHTATCVNTTSTSGIAGQAAAFNGVSSYCQVQVSAQLLLTTDVTLYGWIQTTNSIRYEGIISNYDASGAEHNYLLRTTPSGTLSLLIGGFNMASASHFEALDQRQINDGKWHQVAAVLQLGTGVTFYVDGVAGPLVSANIQANSFLNALQFGLCSWNSYGNYFTGNLNLVRIYDRALAASDLSGLYAADSGGTSLPTVGTSLPTVSITAPGNSATVSGTITVTASASSNVGVASVQFQLDGANLGAAVTASPYSVSWNTTASLNGSHTLTAIATDVAGNKTTSAVVTVTVSNTLPTVSITAPSNNATVSGTLTVTASASSNPGVVSVQFQLDGVNLGAAVTASPYSVSWNTTASLNGTHTLTAIATSSAGNTITSTVVTVTVSNAAGPVGLWTFDTSETSGNTYLDSSGNGSNAACTAVTSAAGVVNQAAQFNGTSSYCDVTSDASMLLTNSLSLYVWVRTSNASRYETVISTYNATGSEANYLLRTTPSGTMSLLIGGFNMASGSRFEALDQRRVNDGNWHSVAAVLQLGSGVTFYVDGAAAPLVAANITANSSAFPLQFGITSWTPYGNYFTGDMDQLRIYNRALAASEVTALYSSDGGGSVPDPPIVSLTAPANGATVSGTVPVSANASASLGVANVQFQLDGANLGAAVTTAPYSENWNTTSSYNGTHTLAAVATDSGGNTATSAAVKVTVNNSAGSVPLIPTGAVGYWSFDTSDLSGNTYLDLSGNGSNAVCTAVTSITGVVNQAAAFNGANSYCNVTADASMLLANSLSLSVWVHTNNSSRYEALLSTYDASDSEYNYLLRTTPAGTIDLRIGGHNLSTGQSFDAVDSRPINNGNWHHVGAVVQMGVGVTIYIDGVASSLFPADIEANLRSAVLQFGITGWVPFGNYFTGQMDEVRIYNFALSAAQVAALSQQ